MVEAQPRPIHLPPGEGKAFWLAADLHTFKAVGEDTGGAFTLVEITAAPHSGPPPHVHHREDETYYILDGEFEFLDEDRAFTAGVGSCVYLPRGRPHAHKNAGGAPARALVLTTPSGIEKFIEEAGEPATDPSSPPPPPGPAEFVRIIMIARKHGVGLAVLQNRLLRALFLMLSGLLAVAVLVVVYNRLRRSTDADFAFRRRVPWTR